MHNYLTIFFIIIFNQAYVIDQEMTSVTLGQGINSFVHFMKYTVLGDVITLLEKTLCT